MVYILGWILGCFYFKKRFSKTEFLEKPFFIKNYFCLTSLRNVCGSKKGSNGLNKVKARELTGDQFSAVQLTAKFLSWPKDLAYRQMGLSLTSQRCKMKRILYENDISDGVQHTADR